MESTATADVSDGREARARVLQTKCLQRTPARGSPCYSRSMTLELIAILAGWISLAGLMLRLGGRIDRVEARLAAVEKETARIGGLLEGLGLTGRVQTTES